MKLVLALLVACGSSAETVPDKPDKVVMTGATPEQAFTNYQRATVAEDLDFLWSFVSDKDKRGEIGTTLAPLTGANIPAARMPEFEAGFKLTADQIRALSKRDFDKHFIGMLVGKTASLVPSLKVVNTAITGDAAILTLDLPDMRFALIRESGQWHWDMMGTDAANPD